MKNKGLFRSFFLYSLGGGLALIIDFLLFYFLTEFVGVHYYLAPVLSFVVAFLFAFVFHKYLTFAHYGKQVVKQGSLFLLYQLVGLGGSIILIGFFTDVLFFHPTFSFVFAKGLVFFWNFFMNKRYNFK